MPANQDIVGKASITEQDTIIDHLIEVEKLSAVRNTSVTLQHRSLLRQTLDDLRDKIACHELSEVQHVTSMPAKTRLKQKE
jgi:hypothetical protein